MLLQNLLLGIQEVRAYNRVELITNVGNVTLIGFLFLIFWWIRLPAIGAIVLYVILQVIGAHYQVGDETVGISYLAHLGGLGVGVIAGIAARYHKKHWRAKEDDRDWIGDEVRS